VDEIKPQNSVALKEWAVVNRALKDGVQAVLLRKGGIEEENGVFTVKEKEFFVYPTFEHQSADGLQPAYHPWLAPPRDERSLPLTVYAVADTVLRVTDFTTLKKLVPFTVWTEGFLRQRFDYKPLKPLHLIVTRAWKAARPLELTVRPEYAGCVSWVPLAFPLSTAGFRPVLTEEAFQEKKAALLRALES